MLAGLSTFLATTTGKVVLVAAAGGAAVGGTQVTGLAAGSDPDPGTEVEAADSVATTTTMVTTTTVAGDDGGGAGTDPGPDNHGQTVSEFAKTTELEGCEKGQAIAELASSKAAERRQNPDRDKDPCKDGSGDVEPPDDEAPSGGDAAQAGPGQSGQGQSPAPAAPGPPAHAGPPADHGPPAHAGGPKK